MNSEVLINMNKKRRPTTPPLKHVPTIMQTGHDNGMNGINGVGADHPAHSLPQQNLTPSPEFNNIECVDLDFEQVESNGDN